MSTPVVTEIQSQVAIMLPVKSAADFKALEQSLQSVEPRLTAAADAMGTVHFARFVHLNDSTLAFLSEFDGSFSDYVQGFLKNLGPVFDQLLPHISGAPPTPVANNADAFLSWLEKNNKHSLVFYSGYPSMTARVIKSQAGLQGTPGGRSSVQNVLALIFPVKSVLDYLELRFVLPRLSATMTKVANDIGTLHFANFVDFGDAKIAFFTIYDGDFHSYMSDFTKFMGPQFDELLKHMTNPPPMPVAKNPEDFYKWALALQHDPIIFCSAYPTLGVQDVKALGASAAA